MDIPTFKEKEVPVYFMEDYLNSEDSTEGKQFKLILESVKDYEALPTLTEMASILEYEQKALDYAFRLAINTLHNIEIEKDLTVIYNATINFNPYDKGDITHGKYLVLETVLKELKTIKEIKQAVKELNFQYNLYERNITEAIDQLRRSFHND